jgi:hypothetical protein
VHGICWQWWYCDQDHSWYFSITWCMVKCVLFDIVSRLLWRPVILTWILMEWCSQDLNFYEVLKILKLQFAEIWYNHWLFVPIKRYFNCIQLTILNFKTNLSLWKYLVNHDIFFCLPQEEQETMEGEMRCYLKMSQIVCICITKTLC